MKSAHAPLVIAILLVAHDSCADTVTLGASADTTLFETYLTNNLGATLSTAAGTTALGKRSRALYRFDGVANLPSDADVTAATLRLTVVRTPSGGGGVGSTFLLHRMLRGWTEGNKSTPHNGSPATAGEPTWLARQHPASLWYAPGAGSPVDFTEDPTATEFIDGYGKYDFFDVASDVRLWLAQRTNNFGWILISSDEATQTTARRFGAREDAVNAPSLTIEFTRKIAAPKIRQWELMTNAFRFRFVSETGVLYGVEHAINLSTGSWTGFTNIPASSMPRTNLIIDSRQSPRLFYRIVAH